MDYAAVKSPVLRYAVLSVRLQELARVENLMRRRSGWDPTSFPTTDFLPPLESVEGELDCAQAQ